MKSVRPFFALTLQSNVVSKWGAVSAVHIHRVSARPPKGEVDTTVVTLNRARWKLLAGIG